MLYSKFIAGWWGHLPGKQPWPVSSPTTAAKCPGHGILVAGNLKKISKPRRGDILFSIKCRPWLGAYAIVFLQKCYLHEALQNFIRLTFANYLPNLINLYSPGIKY